MKQVNNPLTIIGIFAGLAEVAGTTVLAFLPIELQRIFMIYVMVFPVALMLLFFVVLIFCPYVLYTPKDYENPVGFETMMKLFRRQSEDVGEIANSLEKVAAEKIDLLQAQIDQKAAPNLNEVKKVIQQAVSQVNATVNVSKANVALTFNQTMIFRYIREHGKATPEELSVRFGISQPRIREALIYMEAKGLIMSDLTGSRNEYKLVE